MVSINTMMLVSRDHSDISEGPLPPDTTRTSILVAMLTISIYMAVLVDLKALATFKRYNTLYFWSLLVTSWGIVFHSLGVILKWFVGSCPWQLHTAFSAVGWWCMVTGQSLVLYSRLHLAVRDKRILRAVLIMIIVDFCLFQVPTTLQKFMSTRAHAGVWLHVYHVYERIQLVVFTLQELIISIIYIRAAVIWLSPSDPEGMRHTKHFLIYLNVLCIALDIAIVCEVSTSQWLYEEASQSLAYAIKLTLEFAVLNKVMEVYRLGPGRCTACHRVLSPRSFPNPPTEHDSSHPSPQCHSKARQASISPARRWLKALWPRSKPKSSERLGPFDERGTTPGPLAIDVVTEMKAVSTPTLVRLEESHAGKGIVGTSSITTCIEGRDSDNSIRHGESNPGYWC